LGRGQVGAVAACYFVAAFAALGLPPFLTEILPGLGDGQARWAGVLYVVPTVFSALGGPLWGRLADRFGHRALLLRAQLGLALAFALAGVAGNLATFAAALVLQGMLGGTFAASNAYLGAALSGTRLSWALSLMQGSARAALVAAPLAIGLLTHWSEPQRLYLLFAVLPLGAALLLFSLPNPAPTRATTDDPEPGSAHTPPGRAPVSLAFLCTHEFVFVFATVVTYPYLLPLVAERFPSAGGLAGAALFALPHLCYLALARRLHARVHARPRTGFTLGLGLVAVSLAAHVVVAPLFVLVCARLGLGLGMTLGLLALAALASDTSPRDRSGAVFGTIELWSKAGAVTAGFTASAVTSHLHPSAPLALGALACLAGLALLAVSLRRTSVLSPSWSRP
jgi:MFS family permease